MATSAPPKGPNSAVVHPLVLLSVVDHYNRVAKGARKSEKRVVGVLLGETAKGSVDVSNSFAVPFEEDSKDSSIWYLDHNYMENMFEMFRKVNARERIVGFYSTGPKIRTNDLDIDFLFRRYVQHPLLVIVDIRPECEDIPTQAYYSIETVDENKTTKRTFANVPSQVGAYEAEEVGVEHLLRDINDPTVSTLASRVKHKLTGLQVLLSKLDEMHQYLSDVSSGKLPVNNQVIYNMQNMFNLLPNLDIDTLIKSFIVKTNDMNLTVYIASLVRAIIAMHELLNNQVKYEDYSKKQLATS